MTVSLCIIAYNEQSSLPKLLGDIALQTYPKDKTELVFVNSASTDNTAEVFSEFAAQHENEYMSVQLLDNPARSQASGWNKAISAAVGDVIIRIDAHASVPADFTENNMKLIASGEYVCGGARPSRIEQPTPYREMLLTAESSMFGSSIADYRRKSSGRRYVSSLFHGAYRREVFEKVGGFNTDLGRTEDNELHYRIRRSGYMICCSDDIISYQNIRPTLSGMLKQKFGNGLWIGLTVGVCPECLSIFHFVPFCFVSAILICIAAGIIGSLCGMPWLWLGLALLGAAYAGADLLMSVGALITAEKKSAWLALLPLVFFALHIIYGIGTLTGLFRMPFWKSRLTGSAQREIENVKECGRKNTESTEVNANGRGKS